MSKRTRFDRIYSVDTSSGRIDVDAPAVFRPAATSSQHALRQGGGIVSPSRAATVASPFSSALPAARTTGLRHSATASAQANNGRRSMFLSSSSSSLLDYVDPESGAVRFAELRSDLLADAGSFLSPVSWAEATLARCGQETRRCEMGEPNAVSAAISLLILEVLLAAEENGHLFQSSTNRRDDQLQPHASSNSSSIGVPSAAAISSLLQRITATLDRSIFHTRQFDKVAHFDACHALSLQQRTAANRKPLILRALGRADLQIKRVYLHCWLAHARQMQRIRRNALRRGALAKTRIERSALRAHFVAWRAFMRTRCRVLSSEAAKTALLHRLARYVWKLEKELARANHFSHALVEDNKLSAGHIVSAEQKLADFVGWVRDNGGKQSSSPPPPPFSSPPLEIADRISQQPTTEGQTERQKQLEIVKSPQQQRLVDAGANDDDEEEDDEYENASEMRCGSLIARAAAAARRLNDQQVSNDGDHRNELLVAAAKESMSSGASAAKRLLQVQFDAVDNAVAAHDNAHQQQILKRRNDEHQKQQQANVVLPNGTDSTAAAAAANEAVALGDAALTLAEAKHLRQAIGSNEVLDWISARVQCVSISLSLDTNIDHHHHSSDLSRNDSNHGGGVMTCQGKLSRVAATPGNFATAFQTDGGQRLARLAVSLGAPKNLLQRIAACATQAERLREICDELNDLYRLAGGSNYSVISELGDHHSKGKRLVPHSLRQMQAALQNRVSSLELVPQTQRHLGLEPAVVQTGGRRLAECLSQLYHRFCHVPVAEPAMRNLDQLRRENNPQQEEHQRAAIATVSDVPVDSTALVLRQLEAAGNDATANNDDGGDEDGEDVGGDRSAMMTQQFTRWYSELADEDSDLDAEVIEDELDPLGATVTTADGRKIRRQKRHEFMSLISSDSSASASSGGRVVDPVTRQIVERTLTKSVQTLQTLNAAVENATATTTTDAQRRRMASVQAKYKLAEAHMHVVRFVEDAVVAVVRQQHEMLAPKQRSLLLHQHHHQGEGDAENNGANAEQNISKINDISNDKTETTKKKSSRAQDIERVQKLQQQVDDMPPLAVLEACLLVTTSSSGSAPARVMDSVFRQIANSGNEIQNNDDDDKNSRKSVSFSTLDKSREILLVEQLLHKHVKNVRLRAATSIKKEDVVVSLRQLLTTLYVLSAKNLVVLV